MPKTEVILLENVIGLGGESDQVKVAAGYARNYLIPLRLAIPLSQANKRRLEALRQRRAEREAHELNTMTELGKSLGKVTLTLTVKTGDDGKMFGSITSGAIADALKTQLDVSLDKRKIHTEKTIASLGEHEVELRLHPQVRSSLKLIVKSSTPLPEAPATAAEGQKEERPRTEKRGRRPAPAGEGQARSDTGPRSARPPRGVEPAKGEAPAKPARPPKGEKTP